MQRQQNFVRPVTDRSRLIVQPNEHHQQQQIPQLKQTNTAPSPKNGNAMITVNTNALDHGFGSSLGTMCGNNESDNDIKSDCGFGWGCSNYCVYDPILGELQVCTL